MDAHIDSHAAVPADFCGTTGSQRQGGQFGVIKNAVQLCEEAGISCFAGAVAMSPEGAATGGCGGAASHVPLK